MLKKVVHFTRLYSPHVGGVETHVSHLNDELSKQGISPIVITQKYESGLKLMEKSKQEQIIRISVFNPSKENLWTKTKYKLEVWQKIWKIRNVWLSADIIHIHDVFFWLLPFFPLIWQKTFITFHGYEGNNLPTWKQRKWHQLSSLMTRGNICIGNFHTKWYSVKPNEVSFGATGSIISRKTKKKSSQLIYVGRLEADNGLMDILQALHLLQEKDKRYHLDVFGEGTLLSQAKQFVKTNKLDVVFHGVNPKARDLLAFYKTAFVSRYLSILEALVSETRVIAFASNPLTNDYLRSAPFADDIDIVKDPYQVIEALNDQKKTNRKIVAWAKQQTWSKLANQYINLWQNKNRN